MGRSAKIHKRTKKQTTNAGTSTTPTPSVQAAASALAASAAKKRAKPKGNKRATKLRSGSSTGGHGHVLGGADYVDIMMGSRRREREEALKLPRDTDVVS